MREWFSSINRTRLIDLAPLRNIPIVQFNEEAERRPQFLWDPVEFYVAPAAQTHDVTAGVTLDCAGTYTFADSNVNGISDVFEQRYFGAVADPYPAGRDADGDGLTDEEEFAAGTDPTTIES